MIPYMVDIELIEVVTNDKYNGHIICTLRDEVFAISTVEKLHVL